MYVNCIFINLIECKNVRMVAWTHDPNGKLGSSYVLYLHHYDVIPDVINRHNSQRYIIFICPSPLINACKRHCLARYFLGAKSCKFNLFWTKNILSATFILYTLTSNVYTIHISGWSQDLWKSATEDFWAANTVFRL